MVEDQSIQAELERIAGGRTFASTPKLVQFLRFICQEKLAGRAHELKEVVIGSRVYGRSPDYSPREDATVRVEARRLRQKLEQYYTSEAPASLIRIQLPVGTYVPEFTRREPPARDAPATEAPPDLPLPPRRRWLILAAGAAVTLLAAIGVFRVTYRQNPARFTIALSPFEANSTDPEAVAMSRSFPALAAKQLSAVEGFRVFAPGSSADALLSGTVQKAGGKLRIVADLTLTADHSKLWSASYTCAPVLHKPCDQAASELATRTLRVLFAGDPKRQQHKPLTRDPEALRLYLQGRELWNTQRVSGLDASITAYTKALALDPGLAEAYQGLAASELFLASNLEGALPETVSKADELTQRAREHARKALSLDDKLADAHARLGNIYLYQDWDVPAGELEMQRALTLEPGRSEYVRWYAMAGILSGHLNDVLQELELARLANPNAEETLTSLGFLYRELGRRDEALSLAAEAIQTAPRYAHSRLLAALLDEDAGEAQNALDSLDRCAPSSWAQPLCLAETAFVHAKNGKPGEARQIVAGLLRGPTPALAALPLFALNDTEAAIRSLETAAKVKDSFLFYILADPRLASLRAQPAVQSFLPKLRIAR